MADAIILGVTGYARHGKDTIGAYLVKEHGFKAFAFATALKSMALVLNPIIDLQIRHRYHDNIQSGGNDWVEEKLPIRLADLVEKSGWDDAKTTPEVRRFLQVLGTEAVREHLGNDSWVDACKLAMDRDGANRIVVTDTRFPNEDDAVHAWGGKLLRVTRYNADGTLFDNGVDPTHPSEANVPLLNADYDLSNDGSLQDLYDKVENVLTKLLPRATVYP